MEKKNFFGSKLKAVLAASVVGGASLFGVGCDDTYSETKVEQIKKDLQYKEARYILTHNAMNNIQRYRFSNELYALQCIVNRHLQDDEKIMEDGMLPDYERKTPQVVRVMEKLPYDVFNKILKGLSERPFNIIETEMLTSSKTKDINMNDLFRTGFQRRMKELKGNDKLAVQELQRALNKCGYKLDVDGGYGKKTQTATREQLKTVDGRRVLLENYIQEVTATQIRKVEAQMQKGRENKKRV